VAGELPQLAVDIRCILRIVKQPQLVAGGAGRSVFSTGPAVRGPPGSAGASSDGVSESPVESPSSSASGVCTTTKLASQSPRLTARVGVAPAASAVKLGSTGATVPCTGQRSSVSAAPAEALLSAPCAAAGVDPVSLPSQLLQREPAFAGVDCNDALGGVAVPAPALLLPSLLAASGSAADSPSSAGGTSSVASALPSRVPDIRCTTVDAVESAAEREPERPCRPAPSTAPLRTACAAPYCRRRPRATTSIVDDCEQVSLPRRLCWLCSPVAPAVPAVAVSRRPCAAATLWPVGSDASGRLPVRRPRWRSCGDDRPPAVARVDKLPTVPEALLVLAAAAASSSAAGPPILLPRRLRCPTAVW